MTGSNARTGTILTFLATGLTIAVAVVGMGFGFWAQQFTLGMTVDTGNVSLDYARAFTNDDGVVTDPDFDADDDDAASAQLFDYHGTSSSADPLEPGPRAKSSATSTARYDKDIARCEAEVAAGQLNTAVITEENVYPSYHCTAWLEMQNYGTVPVKIKKITVSTSSTVINIDPARATSILDLDNADLDGDNSTGADLTIDISDVALCLQVDPGKTAQMTVDQHVLQEAPQGGSLSYSVALEMAQWNELGDEIDPLFPLYEDVLDILGPSGVILPFGNFREDSLACESADGTDEFDGLNDITFATVGAGEFTFNWSETPGTFDTSTSFQGIIPVVEFNGTDEEADSPDAPYWSRVAGAFSVGAWVNLIDATNFAILSKFDAGGPLREWLWHFDGSDKQSLFLFDESTDAHLRTDAVAVTAENVWVFIVATYDGSANATGINIYEAGVLAASTDTDQAGFVNLDALATTMKLGHEGDSPENLLVGKMAGGPLGPFFTHKELTAGEVSQLYALGQAALALGP